MPSDDEPPTDATPPSYAERVNLRVTRELAYAGVSKTDAAKLLGISRQSGSDRFRGAKNWTLEELALLAQHVGKDPSVFSDPL